MSLGGQFTVSPDTPLYAREKPQVSMLLPARLEGRAQKNHPLRAFVYGGVANMSAVFDQRYSHTKFALSLFPRLLREKEPEMSKTRAP